MSIKKLVYAGVGLVALVVILLAVYGVFWGEESEIKSGNTSSTEVGKGNERLSNPSGVTGGYSNPGTYSEGNQQSSEGGGVGGGGGGGGGAGEGNLESEGGAINSSEDMGGGFCTFVRPGTVDYIPCEVVSLNSKGAGISLRNEFETRVTFTLSVVGCDSPKSALLNPQENKVFSFACNLDGEWIRKDLLLNYKFEAGSSSESTGILEGNII